MEIRQNTGRLRARVSGGRFPGFFLLIWLLPALLPGAAGCARTPPEPPPNILWVVWDTVRADHLSLYGYPRPTTPFLEQWARNARVFENCTSPAPTTSPSHASMFTGLMPTEHRTSNTDTFLPDACTTIAELLRGRGYRTYLYSANPHIAGRCNFTQGFETAEHPWDPQYNARALAIVRAKVPAQDTSSNLPEMIRTRRVSQWSIKASGELAAEGAANWLGRTPAEKPFLIFLNYMEAHHPCIPPEPYRRRMMTDNQTARSYAIDRSYTQRWLYSFGLRDFGADELDIFSATYDAALAELDELFKNLIARLSEMGCLDNTVIVLTSDHGEHLGEHHLLDHQYSLYRPLLNVPLIVYYPKRFPAGRDPRPVMNMDIFATLLELTGTPAPEESRSHAVSLLAPRSRRLRLAEYPVVLMPPIRHVKKLAPDWNPGPWLRQLRSAEDGRHKYIWSSNGAQALFDLKSDPSESQNLAEDQPALRDSLHAQLESRVRQFRAVKAGPQEPPALREQERRRLEALGYL